MKEQKDLLARVREGVAEIAASREQVQAHLAPLEGSAAKLREQQAKALELGRADLAEMAARHAASAETQISALRGQIELLNEEERKLAELGERLQSKIDPLAYMHSQAAEEKENERRRPYAESRTADAAAMNNDLEAAVSALGGLLAASLKAGDLVSFSMLKTPASPPQWRHAELEQPEPAPVLEAFIPQHLTGLSKVFGKGKHEQAVAEGRAWYEQAVSVHRAREERRTRALAAADAEWQAAANAANAQARKQHQEIDAFEADYRRGDLDAIVAYCSLVLEASRYPGGFPQKFKFAYVPESRQAVVEYELPTVEVVPAIKAYRYVKATDTITESPRPQAQIKALYASVVAQVAIRTLYELFRSDKGGHIHTVVFNGVVDTTDPGSGRRIRAVPGDGAHHVGVIQRARPVARRALGMP